MLEQYLSEILKQQITEQQILKPKIYFALGTY